MSKFVIGFLFCFVCLLSNAQKETSKYKNISDSFITHYNDGKYDNIFNLFSDEMKKFLTIDKTNEFLSGLKIEAGAVQSKNFERIEKGYAVYKTIFKKATLVLNLSIDNNSKINGFNIGKFISKKHTILIRNKTPMQLPFNGSWNVTWGGDNKEQNYHLESTAQKNAFDIVIKDKTGKSYSNEGTKNEDYYAFGKELIAPCDGVVVLVVDGVKDNIPGVLNPIYVPGNTVIIKTISNEFLFFAHFKQNSIKVKQNQKVKQGQLLGLCGNSGNSSEAHLHFHIQNIEDMNEATGTKCYFNNILVNGIINNDYSPIKDEIISNIKK